MRKALEEFVTNHISGNEQHTLTSFIEKPGFLAMPTMGEILKPERLDKLTDNDFKLLYRAAKGRFQEVSAAAKRRGWDQEPVSKEPTGVVPLFK
jgi:hypothetical protein